MSDLPEILIHTHNITGERIYEFCGICIHEKMLVALMNKHLEEQDKEMKKAPMYFVEEAIDYIHARLPYLDIDDIEAVLEMEEGYMRSIGIIIEEGEVEYDQ